MELETIQAIAALLPGNWNIVQQYEHMKDNFHMVEEATGTALFVRPVYGKEERTSISFSVPRHKDGTLTKHGEQITLYNDEGPGSEEIPSITVSDKKTVEKIAKDIQSKVLDESRRLHKKAIEKIAAIKNAKDNQNSLRDQFANLFGEQVRPDVVQIRLNTHGSGTWGRCGYGDAIINGGADPTVDFTLHSLPKEKALKLANFLKQEIFN